jgi:hypothetical protein
MKHTYKQISDYILSHNERIKFQDIEKNDVGNNIQNFFNSFFEINDDKNTVFVSNNLIQTSLKKRRTITDIYLISKYYFPRIKLSTVYSELVRLIMGKKIVSSLCGDINSRVYRLNYAPSKYGFNGFPADEYRVDFENDLFNGEIDIKTLKNQRLWGDHYNEDTLHYKKLDYENS